MGSLVRLAKKIEERKKEIYRAKLKAERDLKRSISSYRRSSYSLASIERSVARTREQIGEISNEMVHVVEQRESVKRLITAAEKRLTFENNEKMRIEQEIKFVKERWDKKKAQFKLKSIIDNIDEIKGEIKHRTEMIVKLTKVIEEYASSKSKLSSFVRKNTSKKPKLKKTIKTSSKKADILKQSVASKTRQVENAKSKIKKISKRLAENGKKRPVAKKTIRKKPVKKKHPIVTRTRRKKIDGKSIKKKTPKRSTITSTRRKPMIVKKRVASKSRVKKR
ncbi:MAG: hypothetical protein K8823_1655 [Cenarchaeum symbiont of Oopsacas minuta]|nr:hypothetical protein [Cenarchaeum symbiont of Oopsacas minuta]